MKRIVLFLFVCCGIYLWFLSWSTLAASTLDCGTANNINVPVSECQALMDFYNATNGDSWAKNDWRNTDSNVCSWFGVSCISVFTNGKIQENRVNGLSLSSNNLNGTLPDSLWVLNQLQNFVVNNNSLYGELSNELSTWTKISVFNISNNKFYGYIPSSWIFNWKISKFPFDFSYNCLVINGYDSKLQETLKKGFLLEPQTVCEWFDMFISKSVLKQVIVYPEDIIWYNIFYKNNGTIPAYNVKITDIPGHALFLLEANVHYNIKAIDDIDTFVFNLWTIGVWEYGEIILTGQVAETWFLQDQDTIVNNVIIESANEETNTNFINNASAISALFKPFAPSTTDFGWWVAWTSSSWGVQNPPSTWSQVSDTTSWNVMTWTDTTPSEENLTEESHNLCPYWDEKYSIFDIKDLPDNKSKIEAIKFLLDRCIIQWQYDEWKLFAAYDKITYGELYKMIVRSLWLSFQTTEWHWALWYQSTAWEKGLLDGVVEGYTLDDFAKKDDVIIVLNNMLSFIWKEKSLSNRTVSPGIVRRWNFAVLLHSLIK